MVLNSNSNGSNNTRIHYNSNARNSISKHKAAVLQVGLSLSAAEPRQDGI